MLYRHICLETYCCKILFNGLNQVHANWCGFKAWIDGWLDQCKPIYTGCGWNGYVKCAYLFMQHIYTFSASAWQRMQKHVIFEKYIWIILIFLSWCIVLFSYKSEVSISKKKNNRKYNVIYSFLRKLNWSGCHEGKTIYNEVLFWKYFFHALKFIHSFEKHWKFKKKLRTFDY